MLSTNLLGAVFILFSVIFATYYNECSVKLSSLKSGTYYEYYNDNICKKAETYNSGKLDRLVLYYPSGNKSAEIPFKDNLKHGTANEWFEDGNLSSIREYKFGHLDGFTRLFFKNHSIVTSLISYKKDVRDGMFYKAYTDGSRSGTYKNNKLHGDLIHIDNITGIKIIYQYVNGKKEGISELYNINDDLIETMVYKNDKKNGPHTVYDLEENIVSIVNYVDDVAMLSNKF